MPISHGRSRLAITATALLLALAGTVGAAAPAQALPTPARRGAPGTEAPRACAPAGAAVGFSDGLDKVSRGGATVGGLSSLTYDRRRHAWASTVDNHGSDPARIWFFRDLSHPRLVGAPLVLRRPDGTAYDGTTADDEGLAVLPDGRFLVSSETEPSVRVFGRDGVQQASLPVPARFAVLGTTAEGEATANATLEGLTITPDGRHVVAAMEGALAGDVSGAQDATLHRFLVYGQSRRGWRLEKQVGYRTEPGQRVSEVAAVGPRGLIVQEASFDPATGNAVRLYAVRDVAHAVDVSDIDNLSDAPPLAVLRKELLVDVVRCPSLGATSKQPQTNPLLDNYEGMAVTGVQRGPRAGWQLRLTLLSDDNFSATQITRLLTIKVQLPARRR